MISTANKIGALRDEVKKHELNGYIVPRGDEFLGEFVAPYAERLKWISGFTGSAGEAVILEKTACVLTDGRYLFQASQQTDKNIFKVEDSVGKGTGQWLAENAQDGDVIGYDPRLHTFDQIEKIEKAIKDQNITLQPLDQNLIDLVWEDRMNVPTGMVSVFPEEIAGRSFIDKKNAIENVIQTEGATAAVVTLPDSVSWLLNVRGQDIDFIPCVLSYAIVFADGRPLEWFVDPKKITQEIRVHFGEHVAFHEMEDLHECLSDIAIEAQEEDKTIILDFKRSPIWFKTVLEKAGVRIRNIKDPCILPKAVKSKNEYNAIKKAHVADGAALSRFMFWLAGKVEENHLPSELDVVVKMRAIRACNKNFHGPSFPTIAGFGENAAIIHYRATDDTNKTLEKGNLLLVDSGGQYAGHDEYATTDITRTIAIGEPSDEMKERFTLVLKGHIAVANAAFSKMTKGVDIDGLARAALQKHDLNYAHGTGHGVGCYLAVHEEATSISPRCEETFQPGMLISNEPGYYKQGEYGIRIENLVFVHSDGHGNMHFETIGYAPIDRHLVVKDMLNETELEWLNDYHAQIYGLLSPELEPLEREWLKDMTAPL